MIATTSPRGLSDAKRKPPTAARRKKHFETVSRYCPLHPGFAGRCGWSSAEQPGFVASGEEGNAWSWKLEHESEFPALKLETGRVTYLVFFYLDSASHPISVSRRDASRAGTRIGTKAVEFEFDGPQFGCGRDHPRVALATHPG